MRSVQVPPFRQGLEEHSLMLLWQFKPANPDKQEHLYIPTSLKQVAPFKQGLDRHSLTSTSHREPLNI